MTTTGTTRIAEVCHIAPAEFSAQTVAYLAVLRLVSAAMDRIEPDPFTGKVYDPEPAHSGPWLPVFAVTGDDLISITPDNAAALADEFERMAYERAFQEPPAALNLCEFLRDGLRQSILDIAAMSTDGQEPSTSQVLALAAMAPAGNA